MTHNYSCGHQLLFICIVTYTHASHISGDPGLAGCLLDFLPPFVQKKNLCGLVDKWYRLFLQVECRDALPVTQPTASVHILANEITHRIHSFLIVQLIAGKGCWTPFTMAVWHHYWYCADIIVQIICIECVWHWFEVLQPLCATFQVLSI